MGASVPDMIHQCFTGQLPWSDFFQYMLYLAFLGTISGMIIMSLNYPFMLHSASYTFMGGIFIYRYCAERSIKNNLEKWASKYQPEV